MAASKNNASAESNGGFKTVAFGFDKNDVNMYIASLRKKMKSMEEEFEQKLANALENPAASNDALKHEREVIRAETEKIWGEKLSERNNILKQQQARITELENELKINKDKVESLRTQLSAATSDSNSDGVISARAAKAYMQFTRELRSISSSVEKTLEEMEQRWKGEFGAIAEAEAQEEALQAEKKSALNEANKAASSKKREIESFVADISQEVVNSSANANDENAPAVSDTVNGINEAPSAEPIPEKSESAPTEPSKPHTPTKKAKTTKKKAEPAPEPAMEEVDIDLLVEEPKPEPVSKTATDPDLSDLLAEDSYIASPAASEPTHSSIGEPVKKPAKPAPAPKIEIDDDLSSLLADEFSDFVVAPADNTVGADEDFEKLLAEPVKDDFDGEDDFVISAIEPKSTKGDDLDASLVSDIVINPDENIGDLGEMIKEKEISDLEEFGDMFVTASDDSERNDGLGIAVGNIDFGMDSADILNENNKTSDKKAKSEDDLFDFSFLAAESEDDEDDMSTDVSFSGML